MMDFFHADFKVILSVYSHARSLIVVAMPQV